LKLAIDGPGTPPVGGETAVTPDEPELAEPAGALIEPPAPVVEPAGAVVEAPVAVAEGTGAPGAGWGL
jgi:hypothetical protein